MEEGINFAPLLLILGLAFVVPLIVGRIRWLPVIVAEIIAGVIIGHSGLNLVGESQILEFMSEIGLAFLMFIAGMEIDLNKLLPINGNSPSKQDRKQITWTLAVYLLTISLAIPGGFLLNRLGLDADPWLLAFVLSATSLGVLIPILKQREMTNTPAGQSIFYSAMLADFLTVILLTVFVITLRQGFNLEVLSIGLLFLAFFVIYRISTRFFRIPIIRFLIEELSSVTVQIKVRGAITILMAFVVMALALGIELILGAFLAGMIISLIRRPEDIDVVHKLESFGFGFFIPIFFILVGANLDLGAVVESPESLLLLPLLFLVAIVVKMAPALLFKRLLSWRETLASGALLNTHLSVEIAVVVIGAQLGLLSPAANAVIILFAMLTVLSMPVLFNLLMPQKAEQEQRLHLIFGAEDIGLQVAKVLKKHSESVRFLDPDPRLVNKARRAGFETIQADSIKACLQEAAKKGDIQSLLVLSSDDTRNLLVCHAANQLGIDHTVSLVNDPSKLNEYRFLGVQTYTPTMYQPAVLAMLARSEDIFTLLTSTDDEQDIRQVSLKNALLGNQRLRTLGLPGNISILAIGRNGDMIVPHGNTRLEIGDRLTLFGDASTLNPIARWIESSPPGNYNSKSEEQPLNGGANHRNTTAREFYTDIQSA
jgi:Kef-type K+ transport system membrane component KefB/Trk K+ transport system NAD-binding subunit